MAELRGKAKALKELFSKGKSEAGELREQAAELAKQLKERTEALLEHAKDNIDMVKDAGFEIGLNGGQFIHTETGKRRGQDVTTTNTITALGWDDQSPESGTLHVSTKKSEVITAGDITETNTNNMEAVHGYGHIYANKVESNTDKPSALKAAKIDESGTATIATGDPSKPILASVVSEKEALEQAIAYYTEMLAYVANFKDKYKTALTAKVKAEDSAIEDK